jgi:hypothetical protein
MAMPSSLFLVASNRPRQQQPDSSERHQQQHELGGGRSRQHLLRQLQALPHALRQNRTGAVQFPPHLLRPGHHRKHGLHLGGPHHLREAARLRAVVGQKRGVGSHP